MWHVIESGWLTEGLPEATRLIQGNITSSCWYLIEASILSVRPCRKINGGIKYPSQVITPNITMWIKLLVFINVGTFWGTEETSGYSVSSSSDPSRKLANLEKNKTKHVRLDCSRALLHGLSDCFLWLLIKCHLFSSCKSNSERLHALPASQET